MLNRTVEAPEGHHDYVCERLTNLSVACAASAVSLIRDLRENDPDDDELAGRFASGREVYAARLNGCTAYRLIVSVAKPPNQTVLIHDVLPMQTLKTAETWSLACRGTVERQIIRRDDPWEPLQGK